MVKLSALSLLAASLLAGCTKPNNATCADDYCQDETLPFCDKDGFLEGAENACIAVDCTPNELVACHTASEAYYCNATGNDINISPCANGCDEAMGGCIDEIIVEEECIANTVACDGDVVKRCNADGVLSVEACDVSCVADPEPHCAYLEPKYLPDICDVPATGHVDFGPFDTNIDSQCTGGIVAQVDGPEICVVRAHTLTVPVGVNARITGSRALVLVTDEDLQLAGTLDVSADSTVSGPGGGVSSWTGGEGSAGIGGGGAGFGTAGGAGGTETVSGGASNAGEAFDAASPVFRGGTGYSGDITDARPSHGGGGGGAAMLVSCRGAVTVSGVIDAGGGGGMGGKDRDPRVAVTVEIGGGGGGAGGLIVLQGLGVVVTGRVYANGGAGGNGYPTGRPQPPPPGISDAPWPGANGGDGPRAVMSAQPGALVNTEGLGGFGIGPATNGAGGASASNSPGGGGGGTGIIQVYQPAGVSSSVTPQQASPSFQPNQTVPTR